VVEVLCAQRWYARARGMCWWMRCEAAAPRRLRTEMGVETVLSYHSPGVRRSLSLADWLDQRGLMTFTPAHRGSVRSYELVWQSLLRSDNLPFSDISNARTAADSQRLSRTLYLDLELRLCSLLHRRVH